MIGEPQLWAGWQAIADFIEGEGRRQRGPVPYWDGSMSRRPILKRFIHPWREPPPHAKMALEHLIEVARDGRMIEPPETKRLAAEAEDLAGRMWPQLGKLLG